MIKINKIKSNPNNPRLIKDDKFIKLCNSIKLFPKMMELRPIVVDEAGVIQGGNMRYKALLELGYKELPNEWVKYAKDFTPDEFKQFIIKDNVGFGEWDWDIIANEWDTNELNEWGLDTLKHDWDKLDYIEEAEKPEFRKDNVITIIVPDELVGEIKEIELELKEYLSEKYSGCEVK